MLCKLDIYQARSACCRASPSERRVSSVGRSEIPRNIVGTDLGLVAVDIAEAGAKRAKLRQGSLPGAISCLLHALSKYVCWAMRCHTACAEDGFPEAPPWSMFLYVGM